MSILMMKEKLFALLFWVAITLEVIAAWYLIEDMILRGRKAAQKLIKGNTRRFA